MDFELPEEVRMIVDTVRRFREKEAAPLEREFLQTGSISVAQRFELERKGRAHDLWALDVPEEYGGMGLSEVANCAIVAEIWKSPIMFVFGGSPEPALYAGSDYLKERYLHPVIRGEKHSCYAFTEPDTGSDLARITTRAVKKSHGWVINGNKTFISHVDRADFCILFASTAPEKGAKGISVFLVDKGTPGFNVGRTIETMGDGWHPSELNFTDCVVPEENLLGGLNQGWEILNHQLTHGRLRIAAKCLAIAEAAHEMAVAYAGQRVTFGKPIGDRQAIQWMLADSEVEIQAARLLMYRAAWLQDNNRPIRNEAFVAKLFAAEMAQQVTDRAVQVFGGMGYVKDLPIQSYYRQARVWRIGHGTSEIHRMMIARNLLKL